MGRNDSTAGKVAQMPKRELEEAPRKWGEVGWHRFEMRMDYESQISR